VVQERYLGRIQAGMSVCDARGGKVGSVARVYRYDTAGVGAAMTMAEPSDASGDEVIEVKTGMFGLGKHLFVPVGSIQEVIEDSVFLNVRGLDDELDQFKQKPEYLDRLH
jgi:hypothetical protein